MEGAELKPPWMSSSSSDESDSDGSNQGILIMLKDDGAFVQYGAAAADESQCRKGNSRPPRQEDPTLRGFQGTWNFDGEELILASDRPQAETDENGDKGQQQLLGHDTMFSGTVSIAQINENLADDSLPTELIEGSDGRRNVLGQNLAPTDDVFLSVRSGDIGIGKFMYSKNHPSFFEKPNAPIYQSQRIGTFQLRQIMGVLNAFNPGPTDDDTKVEPKFQPADFYGKKFLLTSEPIQMKRAKPKLTWSKRAGMYVKEADKDAEIIDQQPFDLRAMPIEFFRNNTFQAEGAGKILRGRFALEGSAKDKLWFAVSLFGAGRSAPGSVYSEGPGLTHEDERSYIGDIALWERGRVNEGKGIDGKEEEDAARAIFVEGAITVGQDMGTDTRAIPVARFTMREILDPNQISNLDKDHQHDENVDSIFE